MSTTSEAPPVEPDAPDEPDADETEIDGPDDDEATAAAAQQDGSAVLIDKAEKANRNYTKRLREIFGPDTPLYDCPHCDGLGVTFAPADAQPDAADFVPADFYAPCEACAAWGLVLTGSKQPGQDKAPCKKCAGRGFVDVIAQPSYAPPAPAAAAQSDQPVAGQWVSGKGFIPYGATEPLPNTQGMV